MQNREEAKSKLAWGNKIIAKGGIDNILKAINYYTKSLLSLRSIEKTEVIAEDNKSIHDALEALLNGLNQLVSLSTDWSQILDTLERFLIFYVDSFKILNKTDRRLPNLDTLELKVNGPFTVLFSKIPSKSQKERLKNYLAIISLFHNVLDTVEDRKLTSNDPSETSSFELYKRALDISKITAKFESPTAKKETRAEKTSPPPAVLQPSTTQEAKKMPAAAPSSRFNFSQPPKTTTMPTFDYIAPDSPKRTRIRELIAQKQYEKALAGYHRIMNHNVIDFRCACECQLLIGDNHTNNNRLIEAIKCYNEALEFCNHIKTGEIIDLDISNIKKIFNSLLNVANLITQNWGINLVFSSKTIINFLNIYIDNFEILNRYQNELSGLDGINIDILIKFTEETDYETHREMTKIYLTIIGMFQKNWKQGNDKLQSMIAEIELKKTLWNDHAMMETFELFTKAISQTKNNKGHPALNPELNAELEPDKKRLKDNTASTSSPSLTHFF